MRSEGIICITLHIRFEVRVRTFVNRRDWEPIQILRRISRIEALKQGKIELFGKLMTASHVSLRDDYEVTGKELDSLAQAAWQVDGVLGSRMTGGGFGGCTVSLVRDEAIENFKAFVGAEYEKATGLKADFYVAEIGDGVARLA